MKCKNPTKFDKRLAELELMKAEGFVHPFVIATFREMYLSNPKIKAEDRNKFPASMEDEDSYTTSQLEECAKLLVLYKTALNNHNTKLIRTASSNAASAYHSLILAYKDKSLGYVSQNHAGTTFSTTAIIKQRASSIAYLFSQVAEAEAARLGVSKFDIIQGYKDRNGRPLYGEEPLFKAVFAQVLGKFLAAHENSTEQEEYGKIIENWGALCMLSRVILRRTEGVKLGAFNNYALRADIDELEDIMDTSDYMDAEESHKEAWMERKDRIAGFRSLGLEVRAMISSIPKTAIFVDRKISDLPYIYEVKDDLGYPVMQDPMYVHDVLTDALRRVPNSAYMESVLAMGDLLVNDVEALNSIDVPAEKVKSAVYQKIKQDPTLKTKLFCNYKKGFTPYKEVSMITEKGKLSFRTRSLNSVYSSSISKYGTNLIMGTNANNISQFRDSIFVDPASISSNQELMLRKGISHERLNAQLINLARVTTGVENPKIESILDTSNVTWSSKSRETTRNISTIFKNSRKKLRESTKTWEARKQEALLKRSMAEQAIVSAASAFAIPITVADLHKMEQMGTFEKFIQSLLSLYNPFLRGQGQILDPTDPISGESIPFHQRFYSDEKIATEFRQKLAAVFSYVDNARSTSDERRARIIDSKGKPTTVFSDQLPCFFTDTIDSIMYYLKEDREGLEKFIASKYLCSSYFYGEHGLQPGATKIDYSKIKNAWLREILEHPDEAMHWLEHHRFAQMDIEGKTLAFESLSEKHHAIALWQQYQFSGGAEQDRKYANYPIFILGDSGVARFIKAPRYSTDQIVDMYYTVFEQEKQLKKLLTEVDKKLKDGRQNPSGKPHMAGLKAAKSYDYKMLSFLGTPEEIDALMQESAKDVKDRIREKLDLKYKAYKNKLQKLGVLETIEEGKDKTITYPLLGNISSTTDPNKISRGPVTSTNIDEAIKDFVYNYSFAMTQQLQMMTISPNFYKSIEDLQKRYKEIHASGSPLDINAEYINSEGKKVRVFSRVNPKTGKLESYSVEKAVYFDDILINSEINNPEFMKMLEAKNKGAYSKYLENTLTDGQSFRSIDSYRKIAIAQGLWNLNGNEEKVYQYILAIRAIKASYGYDPKSKAQKIAALVRKIDKLDVVYQPQKPYLFTFENFRYTHGGNGEFVETVKIPVQHKCAEVILIPELLPEHSLLRYIGETMAENEIDVVCSTEVVKVGEFGATDLSYKTNDDGLYVNSRGDVLPGKEGGDRPLSRADQRKHPKFDKEESEGEYITKNCPVPLVTSPESAREAIASAFAKAYVHELSLETYVRQQNVPEHIYDSRNVGTQLRKVFFADLKMEGNNYESYLHKVFNEDTEEWDQPTKVNIGGTMYDVTGDYRKNPKNGGRNIARFYSSLVVANLMRSFDSLMAEIGSNERLSKALQQLVINSNESTFFALFNYALTDDETFLNPLYESCSEHDTSSKLISILKKKVQQQKMCGGSAVQATAFGITDYENDSRKPNDGGLGYVYEYDQEGNPINIKHAECEIPFDFVYTDALGTEIKLDYDTYCFTAEDEANGIGKEGEFRLTEDGKTTLIERDFPGILDIIAYRIPTERAYSIMNLKVKRCSKKTSGGVIKVPAEGTTIAGFDFDIDKLYFLRKEFVARKTDVTVNAKIWRKLYEDYPEIKEVLKESKELTSVKNAKVVSKVSALIDTLFGSNMEEKTRIETAKELFKYWEASGLADKLGVTASQWFSKYARKYLPIIFDEYDYTKDATENTIVNCNNELHSLIWHRMADAETISARTTPGGFKNSSLAAKKQRILTNPRYAAKIYRDGKIDINKLNELAADKDNEYKEAYDVTDPSTLLYYNQQNQIAGTLIGMFANHNSNHMFASLAEQMTLSHPIKLCGHSYFDLIHPPKDTDPAWITAEFLASSVDAVKDPVLNFLNLNKFTADVGAILARLGFTPNEIGVLLNQPVVKTICERMSNDLYADMEDIIAEIASEYNLSSNLSTKDISFEELASGIASHTLSKNKDEWFAQNRDLQSRVLSVFSTASSYAKELSGFIGITKFSAANSVGSTWGSLYRMLQIVAKYNKNSKQKAGSPTPHLQIVAWEDAKGQHTGIEEDNTILFDKNKISNKKEYMNRVISNPFAFEQCEYDLITAFIKKLCGGTGDDQSLFPYEGRLYSGIRNTLTAMSKAEVLGEDTINGLHDDILVALLSSLPESDFDGNKIIVPRSLSGHRDDLNEAMTQQEYYTKHFAKYFYEILKVWDKSPDLLNWFYISHDAKTGEYIIQLQKLNTTMKGVKEDFSIDWDALATASSPELRNLAKELFLYCFYNYGYDFSPSNFIHLATPEVKKLLSIPNVVNADTGLSTAMNYTIFLNDILKLNSIYLGGLQNSQVVRTTIQNIVKMYIRNHPENRSFVYVPKRKAEITEIKKDAQPLNHEGQDYLVFNLTDKQKSSWYHKIIIDSKPNEGTKVIPAININGEFYECLNMDYIDTETDGDRTTFEYNIHSHFAPKYIIYRKVNILGEENRKKAYNENLTEEEIEFLKKRAHIVNLLEANAKMNADNFNVEEIDFDVDFMGETGEFGKECK